MYNISYFKANNQEEVFAFMQANPFVTICGVDENGLPIAAQIPILIKQEDDKLMISGHLMRKQDHTNAFEINNNVLVIFSAPQTKDGIHWVICDTKAEGIVAAKSQFKNSFI